MFALHLRGFLLRKLRLCLLKIGVEDGEIVLERLDFGILLQDLLFVDLVLSFGSLCSINSCVGLGTERVKFLRKISTRIGQSNRLDKIPL